MKVPRKLCSRCGVAKPDTFGFFASRNGRLSPTCRRCRARLNAARNKERHDSDWVERLLAAARSHDRSSASYQTTDLDRKYIEDLCFAQDGRCGITGVRFSTRTRGKLDSVSLDRIDPARGCVKQNVRLTALGANYARNRFSDDDMAMFLRMIKVAERPPSKGRRPSSRRGTPPRRTRCR